MNGSPCVARTAEAQDYSLDVHRERKVTDKSEMGR